MIRPTSCAFGLLTLFATESARANVPFEFVADGDAFSDTTPAVPVAGNSGATLGEQRKVAIRAALDKWSKVLGSAAPVKVRVTMKNLGCGEDGRVVYARTVAPELLAPTDGAGAAVPAVIASAKAGRRLGTREFDIETQINAQVDLGCDGNMTPWYYGIDDGEHTKRGLYALMLHEFAHGLGFQTNVILGLGLPIFGDRVSAYDSLLFDLSARKSWLEMSAGERRVSASKPRNLVFTGALTQAAAMQRFDRGVPSLELDPPLEGFVGNVSHVEGALNAALHPVTAPMVVAVPADTCDPITTDVRGAIALVALLDGCSNERQLERARAAGAVGVVFLPNGSRSGAGFALARDGRQVDLPAVVMSPEDALSYVLQNAFGYRPMGRLGGDASTVRGADGLGRPFVLTSTTVVDGTGVCHFDISSRHDLLMHTNGVIGTPTELDLTLPALLDLGWPAACEVVLKGGSCDGQTDCVGDCANEKHGAGDAGASIPALFPIVDAGLPDVAAPAPFDAGAFPTSLPGRDGGASGTGARHGAEAPEAAEHCAAVSARGKARGAWWLATLASAAFIRRRRRR
jgi:hypothetical protein